MTNHTAESLIAFSNRVRDAFLAKCIRSPVHFCSDTQAAPLVEIFKQVRPEDWVFGTWRNSFHALLKGIPEDELFQMILDGRSMYLMSKEHRFFCSSIVGGILPIALGVAASEVKNGTYNPVWVFIGDMTAKTGLFHEFVQYAVGHELNVQVVVEDNGLSTNANTRETWGQRLSVMSVQRYDYVRTHPHVGLSQRVSF